MFGSLIVIFLKTIAAMLISKIEAASKINCSGCESLPWSTISLARAVIAKFTGDFIEVNTPNGIVEYEILNVDYSI